MRPSRPTSSASPPGGTGTTTPSSLSACHRASPPKNTPRRRLLRRLPLSLLDGLPLPLHEESRRLRLPLPRLGRHARRGGERLARRPLRRRHRPIPRRGPEPGEQALADPQPRRLRLREPSGTGPGGTATTTAASIPRPPSASFPTTTAPTSSSSTADRVDHRTDARYAGESIRPALPVGE